MEGWVWCVRCRRVWELSQLRGAWPDQRCADEACGRDSQDRAVFMPYQQTRRMMAPHWPATPQRGQQLTLPGQDPS